MCAALLQGFATVQLVVRDCPVATSPAHGVANWLGGLSVVEQMLAKQPFKSSTHV
jgi:hypothetical protein